MEFGFYEPKSFWLAWIHGGGTFHANIIPPEEDYSRRDILRPARRPRHTRAVHRFSTN